MLRMAKNGNDGENDDGHTKAFQGRKNETGNGNWNGWSGDVLFHDQCHWLAGMNRAGGKEHVSALMVCDA